MDRGANDHKKARSAHAAKNQNLIYIVAPGASGEAVFSGFMEKWRSSVQTDKMVRRGRLSIHLQKASKLSKEWGGGHLTTSGLPDEFR
jgi:hypothetical protein